ncbi:hypothetical protein V502_03947 [Pseudogymnoascus sp. VKM F-4520 (FW-2644)]|nr:hypothetical protein V502_03947 [Pseudogymnoascus sp. VKM F-4520 (FW-2644)]
MCVKEFIGFNCGHCALPTLRACPIASQSPHFPYCRFPAERPITVPENCPSCARVVWNQRTLANEESHREMHYRLGREECVFEGEKGGCETRFDIDIERELGGGGGRQIRHVGYERVLAPGQMQIETSGGNAERGETGAGVTTMRRKVTRNDRRKSSREIEEAIARVEARSGPGQLSSSDASSPHFGSKVPPGNAYIGYQFGNEAGGHEALSEMANLDNTKEWNDSGRQLHAARLSGERKDGVQNYIGTTKYYPGEEQYRGASWGEMIANVKHTPDSAVPRGPRAKQEKSVQFRDARQQLTSEMSTSNFGVPAMGMNASPVDDFRGSPSTVFEEISAAARRSEAHVPPTDSLTSVHHPVFDGVNEYSPPNRPYRGPAIVSSDMANAGYT